MKNFKLYVIIDKKTCGRKSLKKIAKATLSGGADIIQLRDKLSKARKIIMTARALQKIAHQKKALFIINDRVDIAKAVNSDGVHLGQDDLPIAWARSILGKNKLIGISCHSIKQAKEAERQRADYISIGPIFTTPIKSSIKPIGTKLIKKIIKIIKKPFLVIGGINSRNINILLKMGVRRVSLCRAICKAKNPYLVTKKLKFRL